MRRFLFNFSIYSSVFLLIITSGCTKIDSTSLGADLIPAVDNVTTFADTLEVFGTQGIFYDSTKLSVTSDHVIGAITNDPYFGTTRADAFLELKPGFFPFYFGAAGDTVVAVLHGTPGTSGFDSAVLCLSFKAFYGDTTIPHNLRVYKIDNTTTNFYDTARYLNFQPNGNLTAISPSTPIFVPSLRDTVHFLGSVRDSITSQIRIKLDDQFLSDLIANLDSSATGSGNNIYRSDSIFKSFFRGFAIKSDETPGQNGLFAVNFTDAATRLEIHYRKRKNNILDTSYTSFSFLNGSTTSITGGAHGAYLRRDSSNAEIKNPQNDALYLQTSPGSFATLRIPAISNLSNRIIHRAELVIEQIPSTTPGNIALDNALTPPSYLYLDLVDSSIGNTFKPLPYDLNPSSIYYPNNNDLTLFPTGGINFSYYGGFLKTRTDVSGKVINYYDFNISRYLQNTVTNKTTNFTFRLSAPYVINYAPESLLYNNRLAFGRVKVGNGNNTNYKLRLRVVYSKI